jgi:hypothetical protein
MWADFAANALAQAAASCGAAVDADFTGKFQCYQPHIGGYRAAAEIMPRPHGSRLAADGLLQGDLEAMESGGRTSDVE